MRRETRQAAPVRTRWFWIRLIGSAVSISLLVPDPRHPIRVSTSDARPETPACRARMFI